MGSSAQIPSPINEAWFIISYFLVDCDIYFDLRKEWGLNARCALAAVSQPPVLPAVLVAF